MGRTLTHRIDLQLQKVARALERRAPQDPRRPVTPPPIRGLRLSDEPRVLAMTDFVFQKSLAARPDFWTALGDRPVLIILLRSWEIRLPDDLARWALTISAHREHFPLHRVLYAANAPVELPRLTEAGIEGLWCNHNAFVEEHLFQPPPDARAGDAREFDALYDARFARFKRHHLAARVPRLALIHFAVPDLVEPLWTIAIRWRLRHARILNRHRWSGMPIFLTPQEVAAANRRARVGLCLSAVEGAMVASIQYLLSGLPVVSTPSRGGRDVFFDADNSLIVEPGARSVAAGVQTLIDRRIDPWQIRAAAITRMNEHRARLFEVVEAFQREHGAPSATLLSREWPRRHGNVFKDIIA